VSRSASARSLPKGLVHQHEPRRLLRQPKFAEELTAWDEGQNHSSAVHSHPRLDCCWSKSVSQNKHRRLLWWGERPREPARQEPRPTSVHQNKHGSLFGSFDDLLKLPLLCLRLLQLRRHFRHGFQEWEGRIPLRPSRLQCVIHILRQRPVDAIAARAWWPSARALADTTPITLPRSSTNAPPCSVEAVPRTL